MGEGVKELYKPDDYIVDEQTGITSKVKRQGEGMYADYWLTDFGYVWDKRARPATQEEIEEHPNQRITVQILN